MNNGLILGVLVNDNYVNFLIDTGSAVTVMHPDKFYEIPELNRPPLQRANNRLRMADGGLVKPLGCANFTLKIGDLNLTQQVTIADLDVPGVLGYDFLVQNDCSIDVGRTVINVKGRPIKCEKEILTHSIFHINVNETVVLPPRSETFMFGIADSALPHDKPILIESTDSKLLQDGVIIAKSVTHIESNGRAIRPAQKQKNS